MAGAGGAEFGEVFEVAGGMGDHEGKGGDVAQDGVVVSEMQCDYEMSTRRRTAIVSLWPIASL